MPSHPQIGLIGAGTMGLAAARMIRGGGHPVCVYDLFPQARARAEAVGFEVLDSVAGVARAAERIVLFLPGPKEIEETVAGPEGILSAASGGTIVVDMSTSDPEVTRHLARRAADRGVGYLDAPVLGRPASAGKWTLPVGGDEADLARCRPMLALLAERIVPAGPSGNGHTLKLLNQLLFGAINAMTAEMMALAERLHVPPKLLYETLTASQAATVSPLFRELGRRIVEDDYEQPTFTIDLLVKDVRLGVEMARRNGTPALLGEAVAALNERVQKLDAGRLDTAAMWRCYEQFWKD